MRLLAIPIAVVVSCAMSVAIAVAQDSSFDGIGMNEAVSVAFASADEKENAATETAPARLVSAYVENGPAIDGQGGDKVWSQARSLEVTAKRVLPPNLDASAKITLHCVHTKSDVFFLVTWDDPSEDVSHKTWVWTKDKNAYEEGKDREDMFAVAFEHTGKFNTNMLSGEEGTWDVWHWKAFRTNPQGYAMDKTHHYTSVKPSIKAKDYTGKNGKTIWIARPEDGGDTVEKRVAAPTTNQGDKVPQYAAGEPTKSAADVRAKAVWANGKWTLELGRKLNTGHSDDTAFETKRMYKFAVAPFDRTGDMDKASPVIELSFGR